MGRIPMSAVEEDIYDPESTMVKISEMFGPTLQGEGRSQGRPVAFVRFGMCNLDCSWCDTPFTWDWKGKNGVVFDPKEELHRLTVQSVIEWCEPFSRIVISGGEPLVQKKQLKMITDALIDDHVIEIETNGIFSPEGLHDDIQFNVSPKIGNSGGAFNRAIKPQVLLEYIERLSIFKFVISQPVDLREVQQIVSDLGIPRNQVWIMPEGRTQQEILSRLPLLFDACATLGWSLATRLHVLAHNDQRAI